MCKMTMLNLILKSKRRKYITFIDKRVNYKKKESRTIAINFKIRNKK